MNMVNGEKSELEKQAVEIIEGSLREVLGQKSLAIFAVPGGSSAIGIFTLLQKSDIEWKRVHFFLLDERWVPEDHEDSNVKLLRENLTNHIDIPEENVHVFDVEKGMEDYQKQFEMCGGCVDIALVGAGPDGHIASLFPGHPALNSTADGYIEITDSPKPPPRRITLTPKTITESGTSILLFFGEGKRQALENFTNPTIPKNDCPAKIILETKNHHMFTDI